jgi:hypothetical protein
MMHGHARLKLHDVYSQIEKSSLLQIYKTFMAVFLKLNSVKLRYLEYDRYMISEFDDIDIRKMKLPEKA